MNIKLLPLLAAALFCKEVQAQSSMALSSMSSVVNASSTRTLVDSIVYSYSSGRGGVPVVENPIYSRQHKDYDPYYRMPVPNTDYYVHMENLSFDSAINLKNIALKGQATFEKEFNTYNSSGLLVKQEQFVDMNSHKQGFYNYDITRVVTNYRYNSNGSLRAKDVIEYDATNTIKFTGSDTFAYNTLGLPTFTDIHSNSMWSRVMARFYYAGGMLDSVYFGPDYYKFFYSGGVLSHARRRWLSSSIIDNYYTYNSSGNLLVDSSYITQQWSPSGPYEKVTYSYNVQGDATDRVIYQWNSVASNWSSAVSHDYATYDANHNLTSYYDYMPNRLPDYSPKCLYTYNSSNLLETFGIQMWDATTSTWISNVADTIRHYYYMPVTGINRVQAQQLHCSIYPVPATAMLNIDISNGKENETAFEVFNTSGQLVRRMVVKTTANGKYTIPVADLNAGTYILHCKNGEMENVKQFAVLR
ncbi:MAG: T9SS type A sorting domain-containing protein [Flavipsychrobacter sp.]